MPITFNYGEPSQYMELARDRQNLLLRKRAMDEQALARQQQASQQQASMMGNMLVQPMWQMAIQQRGFDQQQAMLQQQLQTQPQLWRDQAAIQQGFQDWGALQQAAASDPNAGGDVNRFLSQREVEQQKQIEGIRSPFGPYGEFGALGLRPFGASPQSTGPAGVVPDDDATLLRDPPPQFREAVQKLLADEASLTSGDFGPSERMGLQQRLEDERYTLSQQIRKARAEAPKPTMDEMAAEGVAPLSRILGPGYDNILVSRNPRTGGLEFKEVNRGRRQAPSAEDLAAMSPEQFEQFRMGREREARAAVQMIQLPDGSNVAVINDGETIRAIPQSAQLGLGDTSMTPADMNRLHSEALKTAQEIANQRAMNSSSEFVGTAPITAKDYEQAVRQALAQRSVLQRMLAPPAPPPPPPPGEEPAAAAPQATAPQPTQFVPVPPGVDPALVMNYAALLNSEAQLPALQQLTDKTDPVRRAIDIASQLQRRYGRTPAAEWAPEDRALMVACQDVIQPALRNEGR